jgi:hypothetical protein
LVELRGLSKDKDAIASAQENKTHMPEGQDLQEQVAEVEGKSGQGAKQKDQNLFKNREANRGGRCLIER